MKRSMTWWRAGLCTLAVTASAWLTASFGYAQVRTNPLRPAPAPAPAAAVETTSPAPAPFEAEDAQPIRPAVVPAVAEQVSSPGSTQAGTIQRTQFTMFDPHGQQHATPTFVPSHMASQHMANLRQDSTAPMSGAPSTTAPMTIVPEPIPTGTVIEGTVLEGDFHGDPCCGGSGCARCLVPCPTLDNFEFFGGAHGFTGPANRGSTGSFGFDYGFNWGAPLWCLTNGNLGVQFGFRGVHSNFDGADFASEVRNQYFATLGLFRRVDYGLQGGVVVDYIGESWYYNVDLTQIRGELSWVFPACHELGFWFAARGRTRTTQTTIENGLDQQITPEETFEAIDQFRFFYRRRFDECGAEGRLSAGFTRNGDGLLGADMQVPLSERWAVEGNFAYLIPEGDAQSRAFRDEAWNVAVGVVWYPGARTARNRDYFRPLFEVADNGSFIYDVR